MMDTKTVKELRENLSRKNPRAKRGFLDSLYAGLIRGRINGLDTDVIEGVAGLLYKSGFHNHAAKLLSHSLYSEKRPIIGQRVESIGTHYAGPASGYDILSLGSRIINSGSTWSVSVPVSYCAVPTGSRRLGQVIRTMPKSIAPVCAFFPK